MSMALSGLASGLDTQNLIASLMSIERMPQNMLINKVAKTASKITDLQTLNSKISSLTSQAQAAAKPDALRTYSAASSSDQLVATTTSSAAPGSLDVVVSQTARAQTSVTGALTEWPDSPATITFVSADGTQTEVTGQTSSLDSMVAAVNSSGAGVSASKVASGTDANGVAQFRIQLTSENTGAAGAFSVYRGDAAAVTNGTASDLMTDPGAATTSVARDAEVKLWAGTAAEQTITSSSNTFTDLLPGVNVTVKSASASPVTLTVTRDAEAAQKTAEDLVVSLAGLFSFISSKSSSSMTPATDGTSISALGAFTGDSSVRGAAQKILNAATAPVDGFSPSEVGIVITKNGSVDFDAEKFAAAMAADPDKVDRMVTEIASRVAVAGEDQSDKYDGLITSKITGQESVNRELNTQIDSWDRRLVTREATLKRTYAALETMMSSMNSQMAYLTSQISGLPSSNSTSK
jgi:flagellar hook-associated protein 2